MKHPWLEKYPIEIDSKYLILGTHPPMPYCGKLEFYYGNMSEFWRFLQEVYPNEKLYNNGCPDKLDILNFLSKYSISITDIVFHTHIDRFNTDKDMGKILNENLNPWLYEWLSKSKIETIYFTSLGGTNSAKNLFKKWYKSNFSKVCKISKGHVNTIEMFNRKIQIIDLFSPSPTARRSSPRIKEYLEWSSNYKSKVDYDDFRIDWYKKYLPK